MTVGSPGANVAQWLLRAGKVDENQISVVRVLLGSGVRLFDHLGPPARSTGIVPSCLLLLLLLQSGRE